ncbi:MAG: leucine-rich repeat protein, partial [Bacteroidaceae bacterium]|nr:leucine-rich repeat protein [Bacteroidaceae bacterium]
KSVTRIWNDVFSGCSSLASITIPEGVMSIGSYTFVGCTSLTTITIPEGVTDIGGYTFKNCTNLASITIPKGVKTIWNDAFSGCSSLTSITIPEGVTSIGTYAFLDCSSLATVVLPKNLTTIDSKAFANCSKLLNVYCYAPTVPKTKTDAFDNSYPEYTTLHVPANALNAYKTTAPWSSFGKFETFEIIVNNITLNVSTTTITQGEELKLIATVTPDDAADKSISWSSNNTSIATVDKTGKVTAIAPGTATIIAMANDGSGVKASCEVTVNELIMGKCATPVINYVDGRVVFECTTKEATIKSNFMGNNASDYSDSEVSFIPTYTITAYATKKQYENSDVATCTLCWLPCTEEHQENNNILAIPSKPVLISTQGGTITISGLDAEITVAAYNTAGTQLATATATGGTATLVTGLASSSIAIVKIGDYTIKIAVK